MSSQQVRCQTHSYGARFVTASHNCPPLSRYKLKFCSWNVIGQNPSSFLEFKRTPESGHGAAAVFPFLACTLSLSPSALLSVPLFESICGRSLPLPTTAGLPSANSGVLQTPPLRFGVTFGGKKCALLSISLESLDLHVKLHKFQQTKCECRMGPGVRLHGDRRRRCAS